MDQTWFSSGSRQIWFGFHEMGRLGSTRLDPVDSVNRPKSVNKSSSVKPVKLVNSGQPQSTPGQSQSTLFDETARRFGML
ncbi:hypothetical protein HanXRQr2_Chr16g0765071 [Helianthus annuus]|uniref:Uncharacterized protein n=1 Tax=Helianthus annuus TaxID=4232 RepID=A0A251S1W7_HELAN|nr:hypothetical protein HanXRQr2_Chr16g0765071 [Helianthus annuus]